MYKQLMLIGKATYDKRCEFEATIRDLAEETQCHFHQRIVDMDSNQDSPTFNGGFDAVVHLYRSHLSAPNNGS